MTPMRMSSHVGDESAGGEFMVFPGYKTGSMQIVNMATTEQRVSSAPVTINAHQSELCCLAINQQVRQFEVEQNQPINLLIMLKFSQPKVCSYLLSKDCNTDQYFFRVR